MGDVLIRDVDDDAIEKLTKYAANKGQTLEDELRDWLEQTARFTIDSEKARAAAEEWHRQLRATGVDFGDSTALLAEDRRR